MSYIYDADLEELFGRRSKWARVRDENGNPVQTARRATGLWVVAGVPPRGWECVGMYDSLGSGRICDMCQTAHIRYVHTMEHPDYSEVLDCGCECAGYMAEDVDAARAREKAARAATKAKGAMAGAHGAHWDYELWTPDARLAGLGSKPSTLALSEITMDVPGYELSVYRRPYGRFGAMCRHKNPKYIRRSKKSFATVEEAKAAAIYNMGQQMATKPWNSAEVRAARDARRGYVYLDADDD